MQVSVRIQERVPITSFEDRVHHPEITHHFHQVGLPHRRINQQAAVVPQLEDGGEQLIVVLGPAGQDEVAPSIVGALFGFIIVELQGCVAYAMMLDCCRCQNDPDPHLLHSWWGIPDSKAGLWGWTWCP